MIWLRSTKFRLVVIHFYTLHMVLVLCIGLLNKQENAVSIHGCDFLFTANEKKS